jgi:hypothetical protein
VRPSRVSTCDCILQRGSEAVKAGERYGPLMPLPLGHAERVAAGRTLSRRETWLIRGVVAVVAVLVIVLAVALGTAGSSSAHGCIHATIPGPVGAQEVDQCGAQARATCQSAAAPGTFTAQAARVIEQECRKAGLPVGG